MDYSKLSKVGDSTNSSKDSQPVSVKNLELSEDKKSVLDSLRLETKIADSKKPQVKTVFIDDALIARVMLSSRSEKRAMLSKLTDAQRRRFLERWSKIKDDSVDKLDLANAATLLQNAAFSQTEYNKSLLKDFIDTHNTEAFSSINELGRLIVSGDLDPSSEDQKELINRVVELLRENDIQNSLREAVSVPFEVSDSVVLDEKEKKEIEEEVDKAARELAREVSDGLGLTDLMERADSTIFGFVEKGADLSKVEAIFNESFNNEMSEISKKAVNDSVIDKIVNADLLDEDGDVKKTESKKALQVLSEALEAFAAGDDSKLKSIAETEIEVKESTDESADESSEESAEEAIPEDNIDLGIEDEDLKDSVGVARAILNSDLLALKPLTDKLSSKVSQLRKYPFIVNDDATYSFPFDYQKGVVNPPLTRDEYYSIRPEVPYITVLAKEGCESVVPKAAKVTPHEDYIDVEFNGNVQKWVPILGTVEDLGLSELSSEDIVDKISNDCVPVYDTLVAAAKTGNLDVIDNKFYKKHLNDNVWIFDDIPAILPDGFGEGCVGVSQKKSDNSIGDFDVYGTTYYIIKLQ